MKSYEEWDGTVEEFESAMGESIDNMKVDLDLRISDKKMRQLFLEVFSNSEIQRELKTRVENLAIEEGIL